MGQMASGLGDMHNATKKAKLLPNENTLRLLKDFTSYDRNPLMHKTVTLNDRDEATLFNNAANLIVEMSKEINATASGKNSVTVEEGFSEEQLS